MLGSLMVQRKERKLRIGICQQVQVVTEVPAFTGGIPSVRAIRLREIAVTITVEVARFPAITGMVRAKACCGDNGSSITGDMKFVGNHLTATDGFIQEASAENLKKQAISLFIRAESDLGKTSNEFSNRFLFNWFIQKTTVI